MKTLGIIQPAKLGDLIICAPIAKYYQSLGYRIVWPIGQFYHKSISSVIDYVEYRELSNNLTTIVDEAKDVLKTCNCYEIIDMSFGFQGSEPLTSDFWNNQTTHFDEHKYTLANVPFDLKWTLQIKRNKDREEQLYKQVVKQLKYIVYQEHASDVSVSLKPHLNVYANEYQLIPIIPYTDNAFDWLTILEKASKIVLIDSAYVNLINQLNFTNIKTRVHKPRYDDIRNYPILRGNWKDICV